MNEYSVEDVVYMANPLADGDELDISDIYNVPAIIVHIDNERKLLKVKSPIFSDNPPFELKFNKVITSGKYDQSECRRITKEIVKSFEDLADKDSLGYYVEDAIVAAVFGLIKDRGSFSGNDIEGQIVRAIPRLIDSGVLLSRTIGQDKIFIKTVLMWLGIKGKYKK